MKIHAFMLLRTLPAKSKQKQIDAHKLPDIAINLIAAYVPITEI